MSKRFPTRVKRPLRPLLDEDLILSWANEYFQTHGEWPNRTSGAVVGCEVETWGAINMALKKGNRGGLPYSSLPDLLEAKLGAQIWCKPDFTKEKILQWADEHFGATGAYPTSRSGEIFGSPADTWLAVDKALKGGNRGVPGGSSLALLLQEQSGRPNKKCVPSMSEEDVLSWADEHHQRTRRWPTEASGVVQAAPVERWSAIGYALRRGSRGLPGGSSLSQLLEQRRGVKSKGYAPIYDIDEIAAWMRSHAARSGRYPNQASGPIEDARGLTWGAVQSALLKGFRGLPGGSSLAKFKRQLIAEGKLPADVREIDKACCSRRLE